MHLEATDFKPTTFSNVREDCGLTFCSHEHLCSVPFLGLQVLHRVKQLPVKQVPGHEVSHLPGGAAGTIDQHQGGETAHQEDWPAAQLWESCMNSTAEAKRGEGEGGSLARGTRELPQHGRWLRHALTSQDQLSTQTALGQQKLCPDRKVMGSQRWAHQENLFKTSQELPGGTGCLPMQGTWVRFLVRQVHMLQND